MRIKSYGLDKIGRTPDGQRHYDNIIRGAPSEDGHIKILEREKQKKPNIINNQSINQSLWVISTE
jgi:hypothetical protein